MIRLKDYLMSRHQYQQMSFFYLPRLTLQDIPYMTAYFLFDSHTALNLWDHLYHNPWDHTCCTDIYVFAYIVIT